MQFSSYLFFDGQCEEAFKFYQKSLGGEIKAMMKYEGSPADKDVPAEWRGKILHAALAVGNNILMASDAPPGRQSKAQGFSVSVAVKNTDEAERIYHALLEGGTVTMPMQQTFWSARFGMCTDRFGIPWMVNCETAA